MLYIPSKFHSISPSLSSPINVSLFPINYGLAFNAYLVHQCPPAHYSELLALGTFHGRLPEGQGDVVQHPCCYTG